MDKLSIEERITESTRILQKYENCIPIICEKNIFSKNTPNIDKNKYIVPQNLTIGQFIYVIRKRLNIQSQYALYIFINGFIPPTSSLIMYLYETEKNLDGFLYIQYSFENTFGS